MPRMISCWKLKKEAEGLDSPPYPGELGEKIYATISKEAWQLWLAQQIMLINENHLSLVDPKPRAFLAQAMQAFLFEDQDVQTAGFIPPKE